MSVLHTFLGGLRINENCETDIPGLYASGESATGTHGSNRLSGNAIASCFSLGARSGKFAAIRAADTGPAGVEPCEVEAEVGRVDAFKRTDGLEPGRVLNEIKEVAWASTGVVRNEKGLEQGIREFETIRNEKVPALKAASARDLIMSLECSNLAWVGEMVARCALERKESRGQHGREDYPHKDDANWLKWITLRKEGNDIVHRIVPIPLDDAELKP